MRKAIMQKLIINYLPIGDLIEYANNSRTHSEKQINKLASGIAEFGFNQPIAIDDKNVIIAGHGRLLAAKKLKMDVVPTVCLAHLSEAQRKAYIIFDNRISIDAGWDFELLASEMEGLLELDFDLDLTGFDEKELENLLRDDSEDPAIDEVPDVDESNVVSKLGDIWLLGKHRVICGDSTDSLVVEQLLNGVEPHLMVTDPPYGVNYDAMWRGNAKNKNGSQLSTGENRAVGKVENDDNASWLNAYSLFKGDVAYVWHAGNMAHIVAMDLEKCGLNIRAQIIWNKNQFVIGLGDYHPKHEPCWYAVRKGKKGHYDGGRKQSTVWDIDKPQKSETGHSTQKPVECMLRPIINNSSVGQAVYDPFLGRGTTLIACEKEGRVCYGIELNPVYVDVIVKRWQDYTAQKATLESTGEVFGKAGKSGEK